MSVNNTNPKTLFGGTWEQIAQGRTIVGQGVVQANNDNWCGTTSAGDWTANAGGMGGEVYHTLTIAEMPSHTHNTLNQQLAIGYGDISAPSTHDITYEAPTSATGGSQAHNNMPPYLVVFIWKRTA